MNRIKSIRTYFGMSQTAFAEKFGVDQTAVSNWEKGKNSIDVKIVEKISQHVSIPMDYIYGAAFEITRPKTNWQRSELEDYATAPAEIKDFLLFKYGRGVFHAQNDEKPADEGELTDEYSVTEKTLIEYFRNLDESERFRVIQYTMNLSSEAEKKSTAKAT